MDYSRATRQKFQLYSKVASKLIDKFENDFSISLNPILHVTRHFGPFVKLVDQFSDNTLASKAFSFVRFSFRSCQVFLNVLWRKETQSVYHENNSNNDYDVVIISHADRREHLEGDGDFYFGALGVDLRKFGLSVAYIYTNKNKLSFDRYLETERFKGAVIPRWILRNKLGSREELFFALSALRASAKALMELLKGEHRSLSRVLLFVAARGYEVIPILRIAAQVRSFCTKSKAKYLIYTYEGHAWECGATLGARLASTSLVCIGYQHSSIFPLQYSMRCSNPRRFRPDYIFCSGYLFQRYLHLCFGRGSNIVLLNSGRIRGQIYQDGKSSSCLPSAQRPIDLLALLGGDREDYKLLIDFLCMFSLEYPFYKICLRPHPISRDKALHYFSRKKRSGNISVSDVGNRLDQDVRNSRCACYRDSTAIADAISWGCYAVFISIGRAASIDSLHLLRSVRYSKVSTLEALSQVLESKIHTDNGGFAPQLQRLWGPYCFNYVREVFTP